MAETPLDPSTLDQLQTTLAEQGIEQVEVVVIEDIPGALDDIITNVKTLLTAAGVDFVIRGARSLEGAQDAIEDVQRQATDEADPEARQTVAITVSDYQFPTWQGELENYNPKNARDNSGGVVVELAKGNLDTSNVIWQSNNAQNIKKGALDKGLLMGPEGVNQLAASVTGVVQATTTYLRRPLAKSGITVLYDQMPDPSDASSTDSPDTSATADTRPPVRFERNELTIPNTTLEQLASDPVLSKDFPQLAEWFEAGQLQTILELLFNNDIVDAIAQGTMGGQFDREAFLTQLRDFSATPLLAEADEALLQAVADWCEGQFDQSRRLPAADQAKQVVNARLNQLMATVTDTTADNPDEGLSEEINEILQAQLTQQEETYLQTSLLPTLWKDMTNEDWAVITTKLAERFKFNAEPARHLQMAIFATRGVQATTLSALTQELESLSYPAVLVTAITDELQSRLQGMAAGEHLYGLDQQLTRAVTKHLGLDL